MSPSLLSRLSAVQLVGAIFLLFIAAQPLQALVIDDFSVGSISVSRTGAGIATATQINLDPVHVLGGRRDITVGEFGDPVQTLTIDAALGELEAVSTTTNGYFTLKYGSDAQPLNLDITAGGGDAFRIETPTANPSVSSLPVIRLFSALGDGAAATNRIGVVQIPNPSGGTTIIVPFDVISGVPDNLDLTKITSIEIDYGRSSGHFRLSSVSIVPEPAGPALAGAALVLVASARIRRRT